MSTLLILGGARSGKSRFAIAQHPPHARVAFVATAEARDADMAARIARHRSERPAAWRTIEEPVDLIGALDAVGDVDAVIVDCLTLWVANRLLHGHDDKVILDGASDLAARIQSFSARLTLVSNEVGEGVHPETSDGLRFRDLLGVVNQTVAAASQRVVLMVAGIPLTVKG
jgi:adenosyl cobinamide kinase/adenosyl cobinamide phosphate guanylyltransferase